MSRVFSRFSCQENVEQGRSALREIFANRVLTRAAASSLVLYAQSSPPPSLFSGCECVSRFRFYSHVYFLRT